MKRYLWGFGILVFPLSAFCNGNLHSVNFELSFYNITKTCEITTSQIDEIFDSTLLTKTTSGLQFFSQILNPSIAWELGGIYTTNCIARLSNTLIKNEFLVCYSRETPIRKYNQSLLKKDVSFIDEFCYSEPSRDGYYFEYRIETDSKQVAIDAAVRSRCRYTCIVK